jgi:hypothetical protein
MIAASNSIPGFIHIPQNVSARNLALLRIPREVAGGGGLSPTD